MADQSHDFFTLSVHAGSAVRVDDSTPAVPPIVPSVGYIHPGMEETTATFDYPGGTPYDSSKHIYSRYSAPNQALLEEAITALEGAEGAVSFSSGMAAIHAALLALLEPGDVVIAANQLYGLTRSLLNWFAEMIDIDLYFIDFLDTGAVQSALETFTPDLVVCEVLTNPLVRVVDLQAIAQIAHDVGAVVLVDNTFATPYLLKPLEVGADIVVHSTTKFINGHGDVLGGIVLGSQEPMQKVYGFRKMLGAVPGAFDAWLTLRGMRTLALRMQQSCSNAARIAAWLDENPAIERVYYPGLGDDPCHATATKLFPDGLFGGMIAFEIANVDRQGVFKFVDGLKLISSVTSLGDICSILLHPASSSHRTLTREQCEAQGITEGVLRLSVGIENADDLIADIDQALSR
ncbi:MAG: aminotransferase class I/II-fold pyridoxal phosphate-dependent enzyme [Anaerolineae bacterium]|nr:aminotransferase class I/II-fold pyridoxal phosphate-dependent enzyme [Anaerolineae bacterium]